MRWFYSLTALEVVFTAALLVALGSYAWRQWRLGRALRQSARNILWKLPLRLLIFGLLVIALLGPSLGTTRKQIRATGKDVWVVMDLSKSMDAADVRPTRLERVKAALPGLLATVGADRVALVGFAGDAQMRCPLTYDQDALLLYARTLRTDQPALPGSEIGAALDTVRTKIIGEGGRESLLNARSPVILLFSDGEDFGERAPEREAAAALAREKIPVFVLGVGTAAGAVVPNARRPRGDDEAGPPRSQLHPEGLRRVAEATGGRYFELTDRVDETRELATAVAGRRAEVREVRLLEVRANKYQYALMLALALLIVDVLVTVRVFRLDE